MPIAAERQGKLHSTGLRLTIERRQRLEEAASLAGRSLTAEIERRLDRSFDGDDLARIEGKLDDLAGLFAQYLKSR